ncbi:hypothetical protein VFPPC_06618 [Pochonia chlamydosporia 170]|uniref:Uncharacterized protein n=1 Tax=Pochonia chlamydosporia 170 TaxID=1380566 RepID=A0A179F4Y5_METCM|nr:hypothetical protein VFPPC_06618 [Pochonia chlamydosporia 170]OAQ60484.1 hypothetical protein VFPPC_06618 [Pochonia chlamydosporia 170]
MVITEQYLRMPGRRQRWADITEIRMQRQHTTPAGHGAADAHIKQLELTDSTNTALPKTTLESLQRRRDPMSQLVTVAALTPKGRSRTAGQGDPMPVDDPSHTS